MGFERPMNWQEAGRWGSSVQQTGRRREDGVRASNELAGGGKMGFERPMNWQKPGKWGSNVQ